MTKFLSIALLALTAASFAWADEITPNKCPSITSVQQSSFTIAAQQSDGTYLAMAIDHYDTNVFWFFGVDRLSASDQNSAILQAKETVKSISIVQGPFYDYLPSAGKNVWICGYRNSNGEFIGAAFPTFSIDKSTSTLFDISAFRNSL